MVWSKSDDFYRAYIIVYNTEPENLEGFSPQSPPGVYTHAKYVI